MLEVKRVVIYGLVNSATDHRDYAVLGEWVFDLYERQISPTHRVEKTTYHDPKTGRFVKAPKIDAKGRWHDPKTGRFIKTGKVVTTTQYVSVITGQFVKAPLTGPKPSGGIPGDDQIVADVLEIIEDETGHRLYRTPGMRESGQDRVSIGIQHLSDEELKRTYTYAEFLRELRHRAHNEWGNR